ncbi:hypothetical protein [Thermospira aquatica]|uniref:DUF1018 domain-containing protein n=1 Tax=Thermospira aquatica TaxID=2828656 RepID=A0AAX3BDX7_9SPIR|nr:hypothetical protein [Thermospira aquatica]URA10527.1 hypothetical protein KDW03_01620 [Thermospira aquatica]
MLDRKAYARIHILLKECKISEEEYRTILRDNFEVESSRQLNFNQYDRLISLLLQKRFSMLQKEYLNDMLKRMEIRFPEAYISKILHKEIRRIDDMTREEIGKVLRILSKRMGRK